MTVATGPNASTSCGAGGSNRGGDAAAKVSFRYDRIPPFLLARRRSDRRGCARGLLLGLGLGRAVDGRRLASWPSLRTDIRNAGGTWVDEEVVVDGNLISSRNPDDLPAFNRELLAALDAMG